MPSSTIVKQSFTCKALAGNPLNDPVTRDLIVYLPPGYDISDESYPVVFLLAGFSGSGSSFFNHVAWGENIQQRMDRLISSGQSRPMILVFPDCFTRFGGSQYINSPAVGNYADYLLELVEHVDATFRTKANRDFRAVAGKSSGGYGALRLGMQHPEVFSCIADQSGDKYFETCYLPEYYNLPGLLHKYDIVKLLAEPERIFPQGSDFHMLMSLVAMAACYSPNPEAAIGFDWPIDIFTAELDMDVWKKWKTHDPLEMVHTCVDNLNKLRLLYMDCGNRDEYFLYLGARALCRQLYHYKIAYTYEEFDGGHRYTNFRFDDSLHAISTAMPG